MRATLKSLRPPQLLLVATLGLLPLVHSLSFFRVFVAAQVALLLAAAALALYPAMAGFTGWFKQETMSVRVVCVAGFSLLVWMGLAAAFGGDKIRSLSGHTFQSTGLVFFICLAILAVLALRNRDGLADALEVALAIAAWIMVALTGLWWLSRDLITETLVPANGDGLPLPGVGNSAMIAGLYGFVGVLAVNRSLRSDRWMAPMALAGAMSAGLFMYESRVGTFSWILGVVMVLGLSLKQGTTKGRAALVLFFLVVTAFAGSAVVRPQATGGAATAASMPDRFELSAVESGVGLRFIFWDVALSTIADKPLLGSGPATFSYEYRLRVDDDSLRRSGTHREVNDAHNIFLEIGATAGIPAALMMLVIFGAILFGSFRTQAGPSTAAHRWALLVPMSVSLFQPLSLVLLPVLVVFAASLMAPAAIDDDAGSTRRLARLLAVPFATVGLVMAITVVIADAAFRKGDIAWDRGLLSRAATLDPSCEPCLFELGKVRAWDHKKLSVGTKEWAIEPYRTAIRRHPNDAESYLRLGGSLLFLDEPARGVGVFEKARALDPTSALAAHGLGVAYLLTDRPEAAVKEFKDLVRLAPTSGSYSLLSEAAQKAGMTALARQASEEMERLKEQKR